MRQFRARRPMARLLVLGAFALLLHACASAEPGPSNDDPRPSRPGHDVAPVDDADGDGSGDGDVDPGTDSDGDVGDSDSSDPCANCPDGEVCIEGACVPGECVPGTRRCRAASVFEVCVEDASGWGTPAQCSRQDECAGIDCTCVNGDCIPVEPCEPGERRCQGNTVQRCHSSGTYFLADSVCRAEDELFCEDGECVCEGQRSFCNERCVDTSTSATHCGGCNQACSAPQTCVGGECRCASGERFCSGECVDVRSNNDHCGACGEGCAANQECQNGTCRCPAQFRLCGGECVDENTDPDNCGGCGRECGNDQSCQGGSCVCSGNLTSCAGQCVDTMSSPPHCGGCDNNCASPRTCLNGQCVCPGGLAFCDGQCIDTQTSRSHCGACGRGCRGECVGGQCILGCNCGILMEYCRPGQGTCPNSSNGCCSLLGNCVIIETNEDGSLFCP